MYKLGLLKPFKYTSIVKKLYQVIKPKLNPWMENEWGGSINIGLEEKLH